MLRLVGKGVSGDLAFDESVSQGADFLLSKSFDSWTTLTALTISGISLPGVLGEAVHYSNLQVVVSHLALLTEKRRYNDSSLGVLWSEYKSKIQVGILEAKLINRELNHPKERSALSHVWGLRNDFTSHNSRVVNTLSSEEIEPALQLCFRVWALLDQLVANRSLKFPFHEPATHARGLRHFCQPHSQFDDFCAEYTKQVAFAKIWMKTPLA